MDLVCDRSFDSSLSYQIVSLLLESGVDINLRNYRGQVDFFLIAFFGFTFISLNTLKLVFCLMVNRLL